MAVRTSSVQPRTLSGFDALELRTGFDRRNDDHTLTLQFWKWGAHAPSRVVRDVLVANIGGKAIRRGGASNRTPVLRSCFAPQGGRGACAPL